MAQSPKSVLALVKAVHPLIAIEEVVLALANSNTLVKLSIVLLPEAAVIVKVRLVIVVLLVKAVIKASKTS